MKKLLLLISAGLFVFLFSPVPHGFAAVIATWDYEGYRYDPSLPANSVPAHRTLATHLSAVDLAIHGWAIQSDSADEFRAYNWAAGSNTFNTYYPYAGFTVSVDSGYVLKLNSFQYAQAWTSDSSAPSIGIWGYRIDGGSWVIQSAPSEILRGAPSTLTTWNFGQTLNVSQSIEFAFWAYGTTSPCGGLSYGSDLRVLSNITGSNELVLNGSVVQAVPEPLSVALIALGFALLIWRVRWHTGSVQI